GLHLRPDVLGNFTEPPPQPYFSLVNTLKSLEIYEFNIYFKCICCAVCNKLDFMLITNRSLKEEDGEEIVTYDHLCKNCHHVVARHEYTFSIMDEFQEYTMLCLLCGKAEDTISILPDDPRQMTLLF
ncbi:hypothetical protein STEG23_007331, partial [Scotinomys teguina]